MEKDTVAKSTLDKKSKCNAVMDFLCINFDIIREYNYNVTRISKIIYNKNNLNNNK